MTTNPFISQPQAKFAQNITGHPEDESPASNWADSAGEHADGEFGFVQHHKIFLKRIGSLSVLFLVLVFSVFREVKHSRELFQMNQLVAAADAQRRQWQELQRLDAAREACLMAELLRLQAVSRETMIVKAAYHVPARGR